MGQPTPLLQKTSSELFHPLTEKHNQARWGAVTSQHAGEWLQSLPITSCGMRVLVTKPGVWQLDCAWVPIYVNLTLVLSLRGASTDWLVRWVLVVWLDVVCS